MVKGLVTLKLTNDLLGSWVTQRGGKVRHLTVQQAVHTDLNHPEALYQFYTGCGSFIGGLEKDLTKPNTRPLCKRCLKYNEAYPPKTDGRATYVLTRSGRIYPQIDTVEVRLNDEELDELEGEFNEDRWPKITGTSN